MPVQRGSSLDPEATKAKVLEAATELFYERGVHAVGVNEIAARANASKLSIYRYFESKEGLVAASVQQRSKRTHSELAKHLASRNPGTERVLALFDTLRSWFEQEDYRGCPVVNAAVDTRDGRDDRVRTIARTHLASYRELLRTELTTAGFAEPGELAEQLVLLLEGAITVSAVDSETETGHRARTMAATLLRTAERS